MLKRTCNLVSSLISSSGMVQVISMASSNGPWWKGPIERPIDMLFSLHCILEISVVLPFFGCRQKRRRPILLNVLTMKDITNRYMRKAHSPWCSVFIFTIGKLIPRNYYGFLTIIVWWEVMSPNDSIHLKGSAYISVYDNGKVNNSFNLYCMH